MIVGAELLINCKPVIRVQSETNFFPFSSFFFSKVQDFFLVVIVNWVILSLVFMFSIS